MTFRITDWHPPIDGVARAESRYHVIDGFGASGACRRAHRHARADDAFSGAHLAAASVRAVEAAPVVHLLPLPSNRCAASRRHCKRCSQATALTSGARTWAQGKCSSSGATRTRAGGLPCGKGGHFIPHAKHWPAAPQGGGLFASGAPAFSRALRRARAMAESVLN